MLPAQMGFGVDITLWILLGLGLGLFLVNEKIIHKNNVDMQEDVQRHSVYMCMYTVC